MVARKKAPKRPASNSMSTAAELSNRRPHVPSQRAIEAPEAELPHQMAALTSSPPREVSPGVQELQQEQGHESRMPSPTQLSSPTTPLFVSRDTRS